MALIQKILGIAPKEEADGGFSPSPVALKLATTGKTDYDHTRYPDAPAENRKKILMVCTEERHMTMANGKRFYTGNHPVETLVPMLHLTQAGFDIDVFTPNGKPVKIETWAMPHQDETVIRFYEGVKPQFEAPGSLGDFVQTKMKDAPPYVALFIPGGHGAMLGLPDNRDLGEIVRWADAKDLFVLAICHGPAALLSAGPEKAGDSFLYAGYKIAAFPDRLDKLTPLFGYMPGQMPWHFGERLKALGVDIINTKADGTCHRDRKLITGDSPKAANRFGKMAAEALLEET